MSEQSNQTNSRKSGLFSFFYCTRVHVDKGSTPILNLSLIFTILAAFSAPWVAVAGGLIALALGYRFTIERNAKAFTGRFEDVVKDAASNVKSAVDSVVKDQHE